MAETLTPMMQQYQRLRASVLADTLLLFRLGILGGVFRGMRRIPCVAQSGADEAQGRADVRDAGNTRRHLYLPKLIGGTAGGPSVLGADGESRARLCR